MPLAPPTLEVRHWASEQKAAIRAKMIESQAFASMAEVLGDYCDPRRGGFRAETDRSIDETKTLLEDAVSSAQDEIQGVRAVGTACREGKPTLIRHLTLDEVVQDRKVQDVLLGVMYNSMSPSFKESAAFGLAAAGNYEWMELDWLKCNRALLSSVSNSWKSIPMIECNMKMTDREHELACFRNAAIEYRNRVVHGIPDTEPHDKQQLLPEIVERGMEQAPARSDDKMVSKICERLDVMIEAAQ